jgi:hypothetical protein
MILIKLTVADERLIAAAKTQAELEGARTLIMDRIERAKTLKAFGREEVVKDPSQFTWQRALQVARNVLGETNVTMPPYPERYWFVRCGTIIKKYGIDEAYMTRLAEHVRDHAIRLPVAFSFLLWGHDKIMAGDYDGKPGAAGDNYPRGVQGRRARVNPMATELPDA